MKAIIENQKPGGDSLHSVVLSIRSKIIWHTCGAMNWVSGHVRYEDLNTPIGWRDHLRWWIEGWLNRIFAAAYDGSREEIRDGLDWAEDAMKPEYLTPLQREIRARKSEWIDAE